MKTAKSIPTSKLKRAGKILKTGLKVGKNYAAYYGEKLIHPELTTEKLEKNNASDIMESLQELKGGGLKVAQMLSMEENLLPKAYTEMFSLAQFSVPPLSAPLVKKTFRKHFGKNPEEVFEEFDYDSKFAASIGQVHEAWLSGQKLAVKIQYPGVADSIKSDLAMLKPLAGKLFRINMNDAEKYFAEVEDKLYEETNYTLEIQNSIELTQACEWMDGFRFPTYYPAYSCDRIITMEWIEGTHLSTYLKQNPSQEERNSIGQRLWDFYNYQIHTLQKMHADPHPGNLLMTPEGDLAVLDFGCTKEIPPSFYKSYFEVLDRGVLENRDRYLEVMTDLEVLLEEDSEEEREYFAKIFHDMLSLVLQPFHSEQFDFSNKDFFTRLASMGEQFSKEALKSKYNPNRGSTHFIYVNRTFFGLYQLLHMLGATIDTTIKQSETVH
ncbi:MAG: putative unusual protein kinase regulating ubiquinone biosynthesis (AarF/ABC1/UbiB family) [Saprospiraceae bacterium]|jgi:predicted unusual protein kinase regulating ubiquinone biosynthesis (AarF/ABC1/UbiB family)